MEQLLQASGLNMAAYDFPPYSHSQPFLTADFMGRKRLISPEAQMASPLFDKRIRHNSLEYVLDINSQPVQPAFVRKVTLEDLMRGIDSLNMNTVKREDIQKTSLQSKTCSRLKVMLRLRLWNLANLDQSLINNGLKSTASNKLLTVIVPPFWWLRIEQLISLGIWVTGCLRTMAAIGPQKV